MTTLYLSVWGLALFYPVDGSLHAFMPSAGPNDFGGVDEHHCQLYVPTQYLRDPGNPPDPDLDGKCLEFNSGSANPQKLLQQLRKSMVDLYLAASEPIDQALLSSSSNQRLRSRISVPAGEIKTLSQYVFRWRHRDRPTLPFVTTIVIPNVSNDPQLELSSLDDQTYAESIPLLPDKNGIIEVGVSYLPSDTMPMQATRGQLSPHFIALYGLYDDPDELVVPAYEKEIVPGAPAPSLPSVFGPHTEGDPFTCVHGYASQ